MNAVKPSAIFKKHATFSILSIALFIATYLLLFAISLGIASFCFYFGFMLFGYFSILALLIGVGLLLLGSLLTYFMIKFLFTSKKQDYSHLIEIQEKDESQLVKLIHDIADKVGTKHPKRIFLSPEVNASVFHSSNFWSLFFPVPKNLVVGMGLLNSVTVDELEAVLAHEFGHFSQKSMAVGSYVYQVNRAIYNMLYENDELGEASGFMAQLSAIFGIFLLIGLKFIGAIQFILAQLYKLINRSFNALSREMEFHADAISAQVCGSEPLANSLLRLDLCNYAFSFATGMNQEALKKNLLSSNLYSNQAFLIGQIGTHANLTFKDELPLVTLNDINKFNKSKLNIVDQWASHPSVDDRVKHLQSLNVPRTSNDGRIAKTVLNFSEKYEKRLTQIVYGELKTSTPLDEYLDKDFQKDYFDKQSEDSLPEIFNKYYDNHTPVKVDPENQDSTETDVQLTDFFGDEKKELTLIIQSLKDDIEQVEAIQNGVMKIKSFDYNGVRYKAKDAKELLSKMKSDLALKEDEIRENDQRIYQFILKYDTNNKLPEMYTELIDYYMEIKDLGGHIQEMFDSLAFLQMPLDEVQISIHVLEFKKKELGVKSKIEEIYAEGRIQSAIDECDVAFIEEYLSKNWSYYGSGVYYRENLDVFFNAIQSFQFGLERSFFMKKKALLKYQAELMN